MNQCKSFPKYHLKVFISKLAAIFLGNPCVLFFEKMHVSLCFFWCVHLRVLTKIESPQEIQGGNL